MRLRPLALVALSSALGSCSPSRNTASSAGDAQSAADAGRSIEVRIGTRGDHHPLPRRNRIWEPMPARLVMNAPYQSWADQGTFVHVVAFTPALEPCETADFYLDNRHVGRADRNGAFAFRRTAGDGSNELLVTCLNKHGTWHRGKLSYNAYSRSQEFERPIIYVHADRGVYKPGQRVRLRVLAWKLRGEYTALPNQRVSIYLEGPDGNPVGGARVLTDEDGIGSLELPLPRNIAEGQYKLVATHIPESSTNQRRGYFGFDNNDRQNRAEAPIQIRRFETPVIEVRHTLGEFLTPAMQTVPFTVSLSYLDGAPFTRARLDVTLIAGEQRLALPSRSVTGPGPHAFTLSAEQLARFRSSGELRVEIAATDDTNRKDTVVRSLRVVDNPYTATIELDRNGYATGEMVDAALRVTDINSVVQRSKPVRLTGCEQNLEATTDDTGVAHFRFRMGEFSCSVQAFATDAQGAIASASVTHTIVRPMQSRVVEQRIREREPLTITVNFPADVTPIERVVHGDLTDSSGAIVDSFEIPIEGEGASRVARTTIRPPSWGSMLVSLYTLGVRRAQQQQAAAIGLLTDGQSIAVGAVPHLEVTLRGLDGELRPGATVPVQIDVKRDGQPAQAALGVSVVDRGVINMLDPFEHPPFDRFYDPQQKVLASTGAQTLTWPVVQRTWGPDRYDIGWLPSFGMHEGSSPDGDPGVWWSSDEEDNSVARRAAQLQAQAEAQQQAMAANQAVAAMPTAAPSTASATGSADMFGVAGGGGIGHGAGEGSGSGMGLGRAISAPTARARRPAAIRNRGDDDREIDGIRTAEAGGEVQNTRGRQLIDDDADAQPVLIVRTGTDETALWLPRQRSSREPLQLRVPETIGEHQFNVLASDRQGGIALARSTITVRQPLYVRADVPESLTVGDVATVTLVARNNSENPVEIDFALRSEQWTIEAIDAVHASAPARGQATARFRVTATRPGRARYEAEARAPSITDVFRSDTWVRPSGSAMHERVSESVRAGAPFRATVSPAIPGCVGADCTATYRVARLSVAMPESTAWEPAFDYAGNAWAETVEALCARMDAARAFASGVASTAAKERAESIAADSLFALIDRAGGPAGARWIAPVRNVVLLRPAARALEALALAKSAGYRVQPSQLNRGYSALYSALDARTSDEDRWLALRAIIALRAPEYQSSPWAAQDNVLSVAPIDGASALRTAHARIERGVGADPRSYGEALRLWQSVAAHRQSLSTLAQIATQLVAGDADGGVDREPVVAYGVRAARALLAWRRQQHVEPGSYDREHRVYATSVATLALQALDPQAARGELREVSAFLRSNRARWESWFDPEASSLALQTLSLAGTQPERAGAAVIVKVDGREVRHIELDPSDPWESALSLRQIELDDAIANGPGQIEVEYTGALTAQVTLDVERWTRATRTGEALSLTAPDTARRGALVTVRVRATRPAESRASELWLSLPPYMRLEEASLDQLVASRAIASWQARNGLLVLSFAPDAATLEAAISMRPARAGRYSFAALELRDTTGRRAGIAGPALTVQ
ncbi:MAG: MG2 domain-containing protein [Polyangiales bacterium]